MSARVWNWWVSGLMAALVALVTVTVLVVDPAETVNRDLGSLYTAVGPRGWFGVAVLLLVWVSGVAALTAGALLLGHLGWRDWARRDRAVAWTGRLAPVLGVAGLVAAVSPIVPGFPLGLMFFTVAEGLGTAPLSGSISGLLAAIGTGGVVLLVLALCATIAMPVLAWRSRQRWSADTAEDRPR
jgi:hypothetical protein